MIIFSNRLLKKIFESKIEARPVNAGYMAFKHRFSLRPIWLQSFGCDRFRIIPDMVSKFLHAAISSRCAQAFWFQSAQTPISRTGRRFRSAALHRTRLGTCGFGPITYFTQRPMNDRKIGRSDGRGLVGNIFLPIHFNLITQTGKLS